MDDGIEASSVVCTKSGTESREQKSGIQYWRSTYLCTNSTEEYNCTESTTVRSMTGLPFFWSALRR